MGSKDVKSHMDREERLRKAKKTSDLTVILLTIFGGAQPVVFGIWLGVSWGFMIFVIVAIIVAGIVAAKIARKVIEIRFQDRGDV